MTGKNQLTSAEEKEVPPPPYVHEITSDGHYTWSSFLERFKNTTEYLLEAYFRVHDDPHIPHKEKMRKLTWLSNQRDWWFFEKERYANFAVRIQRAWRNCRDDPAYKMCEHVLMRNLDRICDDYKKQL